MLCEKKSKIQPGKGYYRMSVLFFSKIWIYNFKLLGLCRKDNSLVIQPTRKTEP